MIRVNDKYYNKMVSCSMYGAIFTVPLEVSLNKHFTINDENVGRLLLLIDTLARFTTNTSRTW